MEPRTQLRAKKITCIRQDRILFEHLDFTIEGKEIVQIEGHNGAGKTSLLRILAGLSYACEGSVYFNEQVIDQNRELYNSQLLYIGHLTGIKKEMTVAENLAFSTGLHDAHQFDIDTLLTAVELFGFEDSLAGHLSAGQQRRIALAQLWQTKARIWILDEPFTALDKFGVAKLEQLIVNHALGGGCVILTTHQALNISSGLIKKINLDSSLIDQI